MNRIWQRTPRWSRGDGIPSSAQTACLQSHSQSLASGVSKLQGHLINLFILR